MRELRIATRRSRLAMAQANSVANLLSEAHPDLNVSLEPVTTSGDRDANTPVTILSEVGAFVRAVQQSVLTGEAEVAVHSCKDLPIEGPDELESFYPKREVPWDVLCGHDLETLPEGASVGTGSPRRAAQFRSLRPDVQISNIRGNVDTRLAKQQAGDYDAVILAEAGLRRIGREDQIRHRFSLQEMVPAPAQAALAVEVRSDSPAAELISEIDDHDTRRAVTAERALLAHTGAGCRSALGALGTVNGRRLRLTGFVEDDDGPRYGEAEGSEAHETARELQTALGL